MKVISRKDHKLIGNLIVDGAYKYVSKFAIEDDKGNRIAEYDSIETLYRDFKDYKEPKRTWFIDTWGSVRELEAMEMPVGWEDKPILEFETKEEAEKAVKKLEAWTRLEDKGFRFKDFEETDRGKLGDFTIYAHIEPDYLQKYDEFDDDLYLLFGGEE